MHKCGFGLAVFKMHEKKLLIFKTAEMAFLAVNNFFWCAFKNTKKKHACVHFFKSWIRAETRKKKYFGRVFYKNQKRTFLGVKIKYFFQICMFAFVLYCKRKHHANFHKKYWYLRPLEIFKNENLMLECRNFGLLKSCLTFSYLTCSVR